MRFVVLKLIYLCGLSFYCEFNIIVSLGYGLVVASLLVLRGGGRKGKEGGGLAAPDMILLPPSQKE